MYFFSDHFAIRANPEAFRRQIGFLSLFGHVRFHFLFGFGEISCTPLQKK